MSINVQHTLRADVGFGFFDASIASDQLFHPQLIANEQENTMLRAIRHELSMSDSFVFSVAFITTGALAFLKQALIDFDGRGTIVTSTYLNFNTPEAFRELLSLEGVDVFLHPEDGAGFHAKGYVFTRDESTTAIIGSSNLTSNALLRNKEWNLRFSALPGGDITEQLRRAIQRQKELSTPLTSEWIDRYETEYQRTETKRVALAEAEEQTRAHSSVIVPNSMQTEALEQIAMVREAGERRAVVVSATGTGKTILAALDVQAAQPGRVLFIAHREQILDKAMESFAKVLNLSPHELGKFVGSQRELDRRVVFATVQSLSRSEHLERIDPKQFDYILVDEVHRAGAASYTRVINHFEPAFLLGLTATPERTDDFNIYELFDFNVPYEIRLQAALEAEMLSPFHYFGVTDYIDNEGRDIDETADLARLVLHERVDHLLRAIERYGHTGTVTGLMFCSRNDEARALSDLLNQRSLRGRKLRTLALSGADPLEVRERAVARLERGELDYLLTVDIFNEGIDIPSVNQIVMLRQTQSSIIFTQQLGRGLRKAPHKDHLRVIDFIGNYANNFLIPIALLGDSSLNRDSIKQGLIESDQAGAIAGLSSINFDRISRDRVLDSLAKTKLDSAHNLKKAFLELQRRLGRAPRLIDFARFDTVDPVVMATKEKHYWALLYKFKEEPALPNPEQAGVLTFLSFELLNGKRPQELLLLRKLLADGPISIEDFAEELRSEACNADSATVASCLRILTLEFHTVGERTKYANVPLIAVSEDGNIRLSDDLNVLLAKSTTFTAYVDDYLETGLFLARHRHHWAGGLQTGATYSRKDVCRLLNWKSNEYSTMYGYKVDVLSGSCPIFVTYHKSDDVSASTRYGDELLDHSTLRWFTRSRRTLQSKEVRSIVSNEIPLHLFAKKDDTEGSGFHYLGVASPSAAREEKMPSEGGKHLDVVTMNLKLQSPIEEGLYGYLTSK